MAIREIVPDLLWVGNAFDARDVKSVLSLGARAVIDLAANESAQHYPRDVACCRLPLVDGEGNDPSFLRAAVLTAAEFVKAHVPILIVCSAGMSRSLAVVAAAIALVEHRAFDDALRQITLTGPHDVSPGL